MAQISVLMSVFNEPLYMVDSAISSILNQTFKDFEFIIINDNPNDSQLEEFLYSIQKKDNRIKVIKNEKNIGLQRSLNRGVNICKSKYIARMDADDISHVSRFEKQYAIIKNDEVDVVCTSILYIDEDNKIIKEQPKTVNHRNLRGVILSKNTIAHPSVMYNKKAITDVGGYREIKYAEDYDLWLRLISENKKFKLIDEKLLKYRIRSTSISIKNKGLQFLTSIYIQNLFIERLRNNQDSFSIDNHEAFLRLHEKNLDFINETDKKNSKIVLFLLNKTYRMYVFHKIKMKLISYIRKI